MDLSLIEKELKKRTRYKYEWGRKQNNQFDTITNFIYHIHSFDELIAHIQKIYVNNKEIKEIGNYAVNRWYNFHSAMAVEHIFCTHPLVKKFEQERDKYCDFYIKNIPFDHKTSVFPKSIGWSLSNCKSNYSLLAKWLYDHQSAEQRQHYANRIFIILHCKQGAHWKLKAELKFLQEIIYRYLNSFNEAHLIQINYNDKKTILTDLIWAEA